MTVYQEDVSETMNQTTLSTSYVDVIETVISSLEEDQSAMVSHTDDGDLWKFQYGTVEVFVLLTGNKEDDLFKVWATVMDLPAKDEPGLMRRLLEKNWSETLEASFGIVNQQVVALASRTVADLSPAEISRNITIVATIADENDEILKEEFGG
ncbi:YbjN domain-containing protein [Leptolyngbya sp. CCY15150]|uniref:YbjN domain-containing protein n=1 Tax=Leptolyngbya sp. CCY15150 TaxID=2767772 RepID=UPI001951A747|nr:YbjN domain-containing protein [Leptolyngbya sp. CCY15150]